jgi:hypothetical protein
MVTRRSFCSLCPDFIFKPNHNPNIVEQAALPTTIAAFTSTTVKHIVQSTNDLSNTKDLPTVLLSLLISGSLLYASDQSQAKLRAALGHTRMVTNSSTADWFKFIKARNRGNIMPQNILSIVHKN